VTDRLPFGVPLVVHGIDTGPFEVVLVGVPTAVPSTLSVKVLLPAAAFSIQIVNHVVPLTVAPSAPGCVMNTRIVGSGGCCTVMLRTADAVAPVLSCTETFRVCGPSGTEVVFQANEMLVADPVEVKICVVLSTFTVQVKGAGPAVVSEAATVIVPPTVAPSAGVVICTIGGGRSVTVTWSTAFAVRPAPSWTMRLSVWAPVDTLLEFQPNDAVVAAPEVVKTGEPPSTDSVKVIGVPLAPVADIPTVAIPLTVAPSAGLVNDAVSVVAGP